MKHAFTLIELIFVIILIGLLTGIGFYLSRPDYSRQDAQYTLLKLKEARYQAIGHEGLLSEHCVTLTKNSLSSNASPTHVIKSTITHTLPNDTVCFDALGRAHGGSSITLSSLLQTNGSITFTNGDKNTTVQLFSGMGYAIIPCN